MLKGLLASFLFFSGLGSSHQELCHGIVEENDLNIPVGSKTLGLNGLTESDFNDVLDRAEGLYSSVVQARGGVLVLNRLWEDGTVNASAIRMGEQYVVNIYGGLARHPAMTKDSLALVVCHEIGHHLGGAPKIASWFDTWASNEGQSDYFANLKCLRQLYTEQENIEFVDQTETNPVAESACAESFSTPAEVAGCIRFTMAGLSMGQFFKSVRNEVQDPSLTTPDPGVVQSTFDNHPATQCRVDTYLQGSLCTAKVDEPLSDLNPAQGTCFGLRITGSRPLCWFKP